MALFRRLVGRAATQHGYVTTADALEEGATRMALVMLARRGTIEHVDRGLYRIPELAGDPLAQYQEALLRLPDAVLSYDTALEIQDLADVNPRKVHLTVPKGRRVRRRVPGWVVLHEGDLGPTDVTEHEGLAVVTPARAIIDAIQDDLGERFVQQAVATARRRNLLTTPEEARIESTLARWRATHAGAHG